MRLACVRLRSIRKRSLQGITDKTMASRIRITSNVMGTILYPNPMHRALAGHVILALERGFRILFRNGKRHARKRALASQSMPHLRGGLGLFGVARDFVLPLETVDTAGGIHQLLLAREERVAGGADFHADVAFVRRLGLERVAAGANHVHRGISGVNSGFHFVAGILSEFQYSKKHKPPWPC